MTLSLITTLVGIAVLDSLNPSLFVAQFYLLTTPKPAARIISYILGILTVNFFGGILVLGGVRTFVADLLDSISGEVLYSGLLLLGIACLVFGLRYTAKPAQTEAVKKPRSLHVGHTFMLGAVVMVNELTTALPYFIAIERITDAELNWVQNLIALLVYNVIFALPLFGFLAFFLALRQRFLVQLERINQFIHKWTPIIVKYSAIGFGVLLIVGSANYFIEVLLA